MFNRKKILALILPLAFSGNAFATGSAAEEIARVNEEIAVLSARLAELEVKAKIAGKQQEINRISGNGTDSSDLPVVRSIEGADGKLRATLATGGGITKTVGKGEKISGWTVTQIDVNAVTLSRGKENVRLGFGNEPPSPVTTQPGAPQYPR